MACSKKRCSKIAVAFVLALSLFFASTIILTNSGSVGFARADEEIQSHSYYFEHLTTVNQDGEQVDYALAKQFYIALENIEKSGAFKTGQVSYSLDDLLTSDLIKSWVVDGDLEIPKAFSAARDSFLMDHPELFYIDLYKLTISAAHVGRV